MSKRTTSHGTFVIERELPHPPARVFAAWADPKAKAQWFAAPNLTEQGAYLDGGIDGAASREQGTRGLVESLAKYLQN